MPEPIVVPALDKKSEECRTTILRHRALQRQATLRSLKKLQEMLPIMFQSFGILTLATQRQILLECGLRPVTDALGYGISFHPEQALLDRQQSSQSTDPSTPATDHVAFPGNPPLRSHRTLLLCFFCGWRWREANRDPRDRPRGVCHDDGYGGMHLHHPRLRAWP